MTGHLQAAVQESSQRLTILQSTRIALSNRHTFQSRVTTTSTVRQVSASYGVQCTPRV